MGLNTPTDDIHLPRTATDTTTHPVTLQRTNERLSLPFGFRAPLAVSIAAATGFGLGAIHGGQYAGLRFRAENAHRLPTSQVGWYFYHKSKNYHAMLGGLKEGGRMAARLGIWVAAFIYIEEAIDRIRGATARRVIEFRDNRKRRTRPDLEDFGIASTSDPGVIVQRDFLSTSVAAMGVAGAFSAWNRFPLPVFARTATLGLKVGLAYGLVEDALSLLRGNQLGYVEFIRSRAIGNLDAE